MSVKSQPHYGHIQLLEYAIPPPPAPAAAAAPAAAPELLHHPGSVSKI